MKKAMSVKLGSGRKLNRSLLSGQRDHLAGAAGQVAGEDGDDRQADHQHDHLDEVGPGHRQMPPTTM